MKIINYFGFFICLENICGCSLIVKVFYFRDILVRFGENNNWL